MLEHSLCQPSAHPSLECQVLLWHRCAISKCVGLKVIIVVGPGRIRYRRVGNRGADFAHTPRQQYQTQHSDNIIALLRKELDIEDDGPAGDKLELWLAEVFGEEEAAAVREISRALKDGSLPKAFSNDAAF